MRTTLNIDEKLLKQAKKFGLNVSQFLNNKLEELLSAEFRKMQGMGFEPTYPYGTRPSIWRL